MKLPVGLGSHHSRSDDSANLRCLNIYPEIEKEGAKERVVFYGTPGLINRVSAGVGANRGNGIVFDGNAYFVIGSQLIKISSGYTATVAGTLLTGSGRVVMAENGTNMMLVDGTYGYTYDGTSFAQITDADFPATGYVTEIDGYYVVPKNDDHKFYISEDGTSWAAADFASANKKSDDLVACIQNHSYLWNFGTHTTEIWYYSGNADFPFAPASNSFMEWGLAARHSLQKFDNGLIWIGQTERGGFHVVKSTGHTPKVVSPQWLSDEISSYSIVSDAEAYTYSGDGHEFYVLTFPSQNVTWVCDATTNYEWHERGSYTIGRHRSSGHVFFNSRNLVGDYNSGNIYELDIDTYTDDGTTIQRIKTLPVAFKEDKLIIWNKVYFDFETGIGLTTGQGSDPKVVIRWSDDGTKTWSNDHERSLGKIGEYKSRVVIRRAGRSRERNFELLVSDPIKFALKGAYANIEVCQ